MSSLIDRVRLLKFFLVLKLLCCELLEGSFNAALSNPAALGFVHLEAGG